MWKLQVGLETLERQRRGELFCIVCDTSMVLDPPSMIGFVRGDDPSSDLCGFSVCSACVGIAETPDELTDMVAEAVGGTLGRAPHSN
jgi:hypothetical protein